MNKEKEQQNLVELVKTGILTKFPLLGSQLSGVKFVEDNTLPTAATDGEKIYYNKDFINNLTYQQKIFVFAHELMHIAFDHILRSKDKNTKLWNIATDAVINQMLQEENLPLIEGGVDIKEAINHSAEEMYEKLLKEQQKEQQNNQNGDSQDSDQQNEQQNNQSGQTQQNQAGHDSHEMWDKAIEKAEQKQKEQQSSGKQQQNNKNDLEKQFNELNKQQKEEIGKKIREKLKEKSQEVGNNAGGFSGTFGNIGKAKEVVEWKKILKKELEKEEDRWSYRRSEEDNDYMARVESVEAYEKAESQVLLDTSGSIDDELLRNFLRQLKPLLKHSKIYVGCFDTQVYGFKEVKTNNDIDNFHFSGRGGTDFDTALKAFKKDRKINKIIFTDGLCEVSDIEENRKIKNLYWIVFDNKNFEPCCGKVIYVSSKEIRNQNENEK